MDYIIEEILKDDFIEYSRVYELAAIRGLSKKTVREIKKRIGVKTICVANGDERIWLWYIQKNVWSKHCPRK